MRLPLVPTPPIPVIDTLVDCDVVHARVTESPTEMSSLPVRLPFGHWMVCPRLGSR